MFLQLTAALLLAGPIVAVHAAEVGFTMPISLSETDFPDDIYMDSLARLPQVQRADLDKAGTEAFDTYVTPGTGYGSGLRGPIGAWMNSPELAQAMFNVRLRVRYESDRDQRLTELAIISTAREINNQYEYTAHEPLAIAAGLEQDIIDIVRFRRSFEGNQAIAGFGETEQVIIKFAREGDQRGKSEFGNLCSSYRHFRRRRSDGSDRFNRLLQLRSNHAKSLRCATTGWQRSSLARKKRIDSNCLQ